MRSSVRSQLQPGCLNPGQNEVSAEHHHTDVSPQGRETQRSENHRNYSNSLHLLHDHNCTVVSLEREQAANTVSEQSPCEGPAAALTPNLGDFG